jgi:hypothetical protein
MKNPVNCNRKKSRMKEKESMLGWNKELIQIAV